MRHPLLTFCLSMAVFWASAARAQEYPPPPPPPPQEAPRAPVGLLPPPPVAMPTAAPVTVHFVAKRAGDEYFVSASEQAAPARVPCDLQLSPGKLKIHVSGDSDFTRKLLVPDADATVAIQHRNKGLMALGISGSVLAALGIALLEVPLEALLAGYLAEALLDESFDASSVTEADVIEGVSFRTWMIVGGAVAAVGAACAVIGFAKMGSERLVLVPSAHAQSGSPALELVSVGLAPAAGGATAGATFAF